MRKGITDIRCAGFLVGVFHSRKHLKKSVLVNVYGIFSSAITTLKTLVVAIGAGLGVWGVVNLLEGYGNDNPGANAHVR